MRYLVRWGALNNKKPCHWNNDRVKNDRLGRLTKIYHQQTVLSLAKIFCTKVS